MAMRRALNTMLLIVGMVLLYYGVRIVAVDRFHIDSESMLPSFAPGDRIHVNKLLFGARIYRNLDFSGPCAPDCFRLPGWRSIRPGDVVVFNYPFGNDNYEKIEFRMNYVYCKRVLGTPGDTVAICDGRYRNLTHGVGVGDEAMQEMVAELGEEYFRPEGTFHTIPIETQTWNVLSMGPLLVPARGKRVHLDNFARALYWRAIEYEGGNPYGTDYEFTQNWYFLVGDNAPQSEDSRYFGFVPEKFIIGIVPQ